MHKVLGIKYYLLIIFLLYTITPKAHAQTMSNSSYIIRMGNLNSGAGIISNSNYKLNTTLGQTGPGLYSGTNYKVKAGFQYITSSVTPFAFSISQTFIDFGTLTATNPVTRSNNLKISNGTANGYLVTAYENHELQDPTSKVIIPDTTCDNGSCSEISSAPWINTLTYGFGYRCDNMSDTDCTTGFSNSTYYKQFSNDSSQEVAQAIMSGTTKGHDKESKITYKVNISGTQAPGVYGNLITFIATPNF